MICHVRIVLLLLGIACGFAQTNIDWKYGMSAANQKATAKAKATAKTKTRARATGKRGGGATQGAPEHGMDTNLQR